MPDRRADDWHGRARLAARLRSSGAKTCERVIWQESSIRDPRTIHAFPRIPPLPFVALLLLAFELLLTTLILPSQCPSFFATATERIDPRGESERRKHAAPKLEGGALHMDELAATPGLVC